MAVANDHPVALAEQPLHGNAQITITLELILSVSCNEAQLVTMLLSIKEFFDTSSPIVILVFFFTNANILNCFRLNLYISLHSSNIFKCNLNRRFLA